MAPFQSGVSDFSLSQKRLHGLWNPLPSYSKVQRAISLGVKRPSIEAGKLPPFSDEFENVSSYI
jgi:hypothetical protein